MKTQHFLYLFFFVIILFSACKEKIIKVTGITLDKETLELVPGEKEFLTATVHPTDADNKNVIWGSSNTAVATVNNNGFITAIDNGDATITVTTQDGEKRANCKVNVDYRNRWVGMYDFTTMSKEWFVINLDPWEYQFRYDTVIYRGTIERYKTDRLKITFFPNALEPDFSGYFPKLNGLMYPVVGLSGKLAYPEIGNCRPYFQGFFSVNEVIANWGNYANTYGVENTLQGTLIINRK